MEQTPPVYVFKIQTPKRSTTLRLSGPFFVLGRGEPYRIFHEDPTLSREHLAVVTTESGYLVKDLGSRNGVFLNGRRLERYAEEPLSLGDVLVAGNTRVHLTLQQEDTVEDSVTVEADGRSTAQHAVPPADTEDSEDLDGEITGELERPEGLDAPEALPEEDEDPGLEETHIALDEDDDELLGELPEGVDGLADAIDAASPQGPDASSDGPPSELELDAVASDLGVTADELAEDLASELAHDTHDDLDDEPRLLEE